MGNMNTVRLNAYAKINLTLALTGRRGEYHTLDSLVCTIDLFDRIVVKKRKDKLVRVFMYGMGSESISPEENNAQRAGEKFVQAFGTSGADITIYKNIPVGAGLGGSSADAAGVLNALAKLYGIADSGALKSLADELGSDTGYMLTGGFARMTGRGEEVRFLGEFPRLALLLVLPKEGVSTAACYRLSDTLKGDGADSALSLSLLQNGDLQAFCASLKNDLYPAARVLLSDVEEALAEAESFSPWGACMTGSGSGVFAVFETEELASWAKSRYRGKHRVLVSHTCSPKMEKSKKFRNPFSLSEEEREL